MLSMKLLLAFGLVTGIFVDKCDLNAADFQEFADKVTVTNLSSDAEAYVAVKTRHGQVTMGLPAGKSGTAALLAATTYSVKVVGHSEWGTYKYHLQGLRSQLEDITLSSKSTPDEIATAAADLSLVQAALEQMVGSDKVQSCGGKLVSGVTSQVTVKWTVTADGTPFWVLDCG